MQRGPYSSGASYWPCLQVPHLQMNLASVSSVQTVRAVVIQEGVEVEANSTQLLEVVVGAQCYDTGHILGGLHKVQKGARVGHDTSRNLRQ